MVLFRSSAGILSDAAVHDGRGLWHKKGVMNPQRTCRAAKPLDQSALNELALRYVGRFATTRAKLRSYLARKVRERGWEGPGEPEVGRLAERFAELGYVDDRSFALAKSQSLTARGYGKRRVMDALRAAGVEEAEGAAARDHAQAEAAAAALRFAQRRRIGPFAAAPETDPGKREKALAAMIRAGHGYTLARSILALEPASNANIDQYLAEIRLVDD
jgi:regulatory protein